MTKNPHRLIVGAAAIGAYYSLGARKANRLLAQGLLPGAFKLGRQYFLDPAVADEEIRARAARCGK